MKLIDIVNNQFDPGGFFAWHISFLSGSTTYYCDDIVEDVKMVLHLFCEHVWESKVNRSCASLEEGRVGASTSTEGQDFSADLLPASHSSPASQESVECLKVTRKVSFFELDRDSSVYVNSLIWELMKSGSSSLTESFKDTRHARVGKLHNSKYAP
ncbi:hypothetical protein POM88_021739 [Heracleum sosnowskyi]|uniref:Uncharacterized protein n=1 Tax=Heracleum sosnowskyi TaxID=360622 RepID=A0AAD8MT42_9APIA|nr:hypothetical protein POM88_021739 [Heracleum sosnowskyi]